MALADDFFQKLSGTRHDLDAFCRLVFGTGLHGGQNAFTKDVQKHDPDVAFLLPGNSWGKTEYIARRALWMAWFKKGPREPEDLQTWLSQDYKGLVASYTYPIAQESFSRLQSYHRSREEVKALVQSMRQAPTAHITLTNNAEIDWGSLDAEGKLVEAARRNFIFVDEAGHIPELSNTFDSILFPRTMGVGGVVYLFGTPKPHSDPYLLEVFEKGRNGGDGFYYSYAGSVFENEFWDTKEQERVLRNPRYVVGWTTCKEPQGCKDRVCRWREDLGCQAHPKLTPMGRQVLLGEFILAGGLFFSKLSIARMFSGFGSEVDLSNDNHFTVYDEGDLPPGRLFMGAFDLAGNKKRRKGKSNDPTVGVVIDYTEKPWRLVRYDYVPAGDADWEQKYELMEHIYRTYKLPYLIIDATGNLDSVQEALQQKGVEVEGIHFGGSGNRKFDMLRNLQMCIEFEWDGSKGILRSPLIPKMKHELEHYVLPDDNISQDTVMTLCMAVHHIAQNEVPSHVSGEVY